MKILIKISILSTLIMSFVVQASGITVTENLDSHLEKYSQYSHTKHENIDDTNVQHEHSHKHSKNGDEHEHSHEHLKNFQSDLKLFNELNLPIITRTDTVYITIFYYKTFFSKPHLLEIFRPPIS